MKQFAHKFGIVLITVLVGCSHLDCQPDVDEWTQHQAKFEQIVDLYDQNKLDFGPGNRRVQRAIPDSLIFDNSYDSFVYRNIGSRGDIFNGTYSVRFYKLDKLNHRVKEVVYSTQVSVLQELNADECCKRVQDNWYVRNLK
ncbi:MAG: hypothetical protein ACI9UJ_000538 [bacterium]